MAHINNSDNGTVYCGHICCGDIVRWKKNVTGIQIGTQVNKNMADGYDVGKCNIYYLEKNRKPERTMMT